MPSRQERVETTRAAKAARRAVPKLARKHQRWTVEETRLLEFHWGAFSVNAIAAKLRRTPQAVVRRAFSLKLGPPSRGSKSLSDLERELGYSQGRIEQAIAHLGLSIERSFSVSYENTARHRRLAITPEQEEQIAGFLRAYPDGSPIYKPDSKRGPGGLWGIGGHPPQCAACGRTDSPHCCLGRCLRCDSRERCRLYRERKKAQRAGLGSEVAA